VAEVVRTDSDALFEEHGRIIGEEVRALGFNVDFAPVFDLDLPQSRNVLTSRTVSADPKQVVRYARSFFKGLAHSKILGCGKHFPGLGGANLDTHKELPAIQRAWEEMWAEDLAPYRALRDAMSFVMVAHASYPRAMKADGKTPASLSKRWISDVLRKQIGFRGLIISDDLEMGGVLAAASMEEAALGTIRAGADMFLVCQKEEFVWRSYEAVLQEAERNPRFADLVTRAADRVLRFKERSVAIRKTSTRELDPDHIQELARNLRGFSEQVRQKAAASRA
jgi:beta-N-acetylhexosaminidase